MTSHDTNTSFIRRLVSGLALSIGLLAAPIAVQATSTTIYGSLGNFDATNNLGEDAHGFEIQLEGIHPEDIAGFWSGNKYGDPVLIPYATGVFVRYMSSFDSSTGQFTATTVPHTANTPFAFTCYMGTPTYAQAGCDHFGVTLVAAVNPTATTYRWMIDDPANPGTLIGSAATLAIPAPVWRVVPPAVAGNPPVIVAEIAAPESQRTPGQYGDATWVRVYKTELSREVALGELTSDNQVVPQDSRQIETSWKLLQQSPPSSRKQRGKHTNQNSPGNGSRSVLRRYESYAYTGAYDPITHEALCGGDGSCETPLNSELGDMLGAQMAAINIGDPALLVPSATSAPSGAITNQTLSVTLTPPASVLDQTASVFVAAAPPSSLGGGIYLMSADGSWSPFTACASAPAASSGPLTSGLPLSVIPAPTDLTALKGTAIFVGYGIGTTYATACADMLNKSTFSAAYTIN